MSKTGSNEQEANGMTTTIVVVDGADGLTPDMLRLQPNWRSGRKWMFDPSKFPQALTDEFIRAGMRPHLGDYREMM